jgi:hypothetical protein
MAGKRGGIAGVGGVGTGLILLVGGLIVRHAEANTVYVCSSLIGRLGQALDQNAATSCSAAQDLSTAATVGIWIGAVLLVLAACGFITTLIATGVIATSQRAKAAGPRPAAKRPAAPRRTEEPAGQRPTGPSPVIQEPARPAPPTRQHPAGPMVMPPCGHAVRPGARFCPACGRPVAPPGPVTPTTPASPVTQESQRRSRRPMVIGAVILVAGVAAAMVLALHPFGGNGDAGAQQAPQQSARQPLDVSATSHTSSSQSSQPPQQQAAQSLAGLLAQSVADRSSVVQAVSDVNQCGPNLDQDQQVFQNAASSRQSLLSQLASLPDASALPASMVADLTGAWQASVQADQDFAQWAGDEASQGCTPGDHSDPNYQAAATPDGTATTDKQAFASLWDPIATEYGLTPYQWYQL